MAVTIVVPTLGRPTLAGALASLLEQDDPHWRAVVVGDGVEPEAPDDPRITRIEGPPLGDAGLTRNVAVKHIRTAWAGFLDDDDRISPDYVTRLRQEARTETDVVIFRMLHPELGLIPRDDRLRHGNVGISCAVRTAIWRAVPFRPRTHRTNEDYELLHDLERAGARIRFSAHCCYHVRPATVTA